MFHQTYFSTLLSKVSVFLSPIRSTTNLLGCLYLQALTLYCEFEPISPVSERQLNSQKAAPTQLRSLTVALSTENLPVILNLITTCLSEPVPTLKKIESFRGHELLLDVLPLVPIVTSYGPGFCHSRIEPLHGTTRFINEARNLSHLRFLSGNDISLQLQALRCRVQSIYLRTFYSTDKDSDREDEAEVLRIIRKAAESEVLNALRWIKFEEVTLVQLESLEGWNELVTVLKRKGTMTIIED